MSEVGGPEGGTAVATPLEKKQPDVLEQARQVADSAGASELTGAPAPDIENPSDHPSAKVEGFHDKMAAPKGNVLSRIPVIGGLFKHPETTEEAAAIKKQGMNILGTEQQPDPAVTAALHDATPLAKTDENQGVDQMDTDLSAVATKDETKDPMAATTEAQSDASQDIVAQAGKVAAEAGGNDLTGDAAPAMENPSEDQNANTASAEAAPATETPDPMATSTEAQPETQPDASAMPAQPDASAMPTPESTESTTPSMGADASATPEMPTPTDPMASSTEASPTAETPDPMAASTETQPDATAMPAQPETSTPDAAAPSMSGESAMPSPESTEPATPTMGADASATPEMPTPVDPMASSTEAPASDASSEQNNQGGSTTPGSNTGTPQAA